MKTTHGLRERILNSATILEAMGISMELTKGSLVYPPKYMKRCTNALKRVSQKLGKTYTLNVSTVQEDNAKGTGALSTGNGEVEDPVAKDWQPGQSAARGTSSKKRTANPGRPGHKAGQKRKDY